MDKRIRDIVTTVPAADVTTHLNSLAGIFREMASQVSNRTPRTNESVAYTNLTRRTADELERLASFYPTSIEGVAWCARNLFEINLFVRVIGRDPESMNRWLGQLLGDEKQIIEGFLGLSMSADSPEHQVLINRLTEIEGLGRKHSIVPSGPFNVRRIAEEEGLLDEYVGLYKLFSKYVHPSSWLINAGERVNSPEYLNIFVIYAQMYSGDSLSRIESWLSSTSQH